MNQVYVQERMKLSTEFIACITRATLFTVELNTQVCLECTEWICNAVMECLH